MIKKIVRCILYHQDLRSKCITSSERKRYFTIIIWTVKSLQQRAVTT